MDFFEREEKAHYNTKLLGVYFVAGVAVFILTIYLVMDAEKGINEPKEESASSPA